MMTNLPITHLTLYKHGVGFFERRASLSGEEVELSFRVEEMNDILKSLTAIDWGGGQVLGLEYATPQTREERLAGCSIRLGDGRSLRDLLVGLRGRRYQVKVEDERERRDGVTPAAQRAAAGSADVVSPMPGTVVAVLVEEGQPVITGQGLAIVEAMKMENEIRAPVNGIVERAAVVPGQGVAQHDVLVRVGPG